MEAIKPPRSWAISAFLCLMSKENVSLSKNSFRSGSFCRTGWLAIFCIHLSRASLRCWTNWSSNLPKVFFSGTGGTTTPGLFAERVS